MRHGFWMLAGVLAFTPLPSIGQPAVAPAILGYLPDTSGPGLIPVFGVPGAARIGATITPLTNAIRIWTAPGQEYALLQPAADDLVAVTLDSGSITTLSGLRVHDAPGVQFSPSGRWATFRDSRGKTVRLGGLPGPPRNVSVQVRTSEILAISDAGETVSAQELRAALPAVVAAAFLPGSDTLAACDRNSGAVALLRRVNAAWHAEPLPLTIEAPDAIAVTADGRRIVVASRHSSRIAWIDLEVYRTGSVECPVAPEGLDRLRDGSVFAVSAAQGGPAWLLDVEREGRLFMVPPILGGAK